MWWIERQRRSTPSTKELHGGQPDGHLWHISRPAHLSAPPPWQPRSSALVSSTSCSPPTSWLRTSCPGCRRGTICGPLESAGAARLHETQQDGPSALTGHHWPLPPAPLRPLHRPATLPASAYSPPTLSHHMQGLEGCCVRGCRGHLQSAAQPAALGAAGSHHPWECNAKTGGRTSLGSSLSASASC